MLKYFWTGGISLTNYNLSENTFISWRCNFSLLLCVCMYMYFKAVLPFYHWIYREQKKKNILTHLYVFHLVSLNKSASWKHCKVLAFYFKGTILTNATDNIKPRSPHTKPQTSNSQYYNKLASGLPVRNKCRFSDTFVCATICYFLKKTIKYGDDFSEA